MADKAPAVLSAEERLQGSAIGDNRQSGRGTLALWSVLALVVVVLLWLITRLLPKPPPSS
jgi:flagellar biogenesis protein FliO